jgi:hypothetical protein
MARYTTLGTLRNFLEELPWPVAFAPAGGALDEVEVLDFVLHSAAPSLRATLWLGFDTDPELTLADLPGARLVLSGDRDDEGHVVLMAIIELTDTKSLTLTDVTLALRFDDELLRPAQTAAGQPAAAHAELRGRGTVRVDNGFRISLEDFAPFDLAPAEIGRTGIVVSATGIVLDLSGDGPRGARLEQAQLRFPDGFPSLAPEALTLKRAFLGGGGLSGELSADFEPADQKLFGFAFRPRRLAVVLRQNGLVACNVEGDLHVPFFDQTVAVEVGLDLDGNLFLRLAADFPTLSIPDVLDFKTERFGVVVGPGGLAISLGGRLTPRLVVDGLTWPELDLRELLLVDGGLTLPGGWLDLPNQKSIDLHGFRLDVSKLGFGTLGAGRWFGFTGALQLIDLLPAGVSVDGLRIVWGEGGDPRLLLDGVGIELAVGEGLWLKGSVALAGREFRGAVELKIKSLRLSFAAAVVCGFNGSDRYFAVYFSGDLPAGIPIGATGLAIFGIAGLFAIGMEPKREPSMPWYSLDQGNSWYHLPQRGVKDFSKWTAKAGSLALGAGAVIGTQSDDGWAFSGNLLLLLILPGPILMLQGEGTLLSQRMAREGRGDFGALAVLDGRAGNLTIGLDATYRNGRGGELVDMQLGCETFFDFNDGSAWYVHFGLREPRSRRVRARLFQLFDVNAYLSLDPHGIGCGAWGGFSENWQLGPLSLGAEAWLEVNTDLAFKPVHFSGNAWLHGSLTAEVFGFGFGFGLDAAISGDVFEPFRLEASFSVRCELPFPLDDVEVGVVLRWDHQDGDGPVPLPLQEVEVLHPIANARWPLPRCKGWIAPSFADADGYHSAPQILPPAPLPVVPPDAHLALIFSRPVSDRARVGKPSRSVGRERVGGADVEFALESLVLERLVGTSFEQVPRPLSGIWQLTEARPSAPSQLMLVLGATTPFETSRPTAGSYESWIGRQPDLLCPPEVPAVHVCHDFQHFEPPLGPLSPWRGSSAPGLEMAWSGEAKIVRHTPIVGVDRSVVLSAAAGEQGIEIILGEPARECDVFGEQAAPSDEIPVDPVIDFTVEDVRHWAGNPRVERAVRFLVGPPWWPQTEARFGEGLVVDRLVTVELPRVASSVSVDMQVAGQVRLRWFTAAGAPIGDQPLGSGLHRDVALAGGINIARIVIQVAGAAFLRRIAVRYLAGNPLVVDAFTYNLLPVGRTQSVAGRAHLEAPAIVRLLIHCAGPPMLRKICFTTDPVERLGYDRVEYLHELNAESIEWTQESPTFVPNSSYRLTVTTSARPRLPSVTEVISFRTGGPPGLGAALSVPDEADLNHSRSGLFDLTPYVGQTVPPSVVSEGEAPRLHRPFYRGYDVGVRLRANHLGTLYRAAGSDLELFVYDALEQTFRDETGKPIVFSRFRDAERRHLHRVEESWLAMRNAATCVIEPITQEQMRHDQSVVIEDPARPLLAPDTLYEARLERRDTDPPAAVEATPNPEPLLVGKTVYRFPFVTSRYVSFFHQVHELAGRTRRVDEAGVRAALAATATDAVPAGARAPGEAESRACDAVASAVVGAAAVRERALSCELHRLLRDGNPPALLLRSPEPLDPQRVEVVVEQSEWPAAATASTGAITLAQGELGRRRPNEEVVDLLVGETARLDGYTIELRALPDLFVGVAGDALFRDHFEKGAQGVTEWLFLDPPDVAGGPTRWASVDGGLRQESGAHAPLGSSLDWQQRGPLALTPLLASSDIAIRAQMLPTASGEAGFVFRWRDDNNFYRFSSSIAQSRRRLVRRIAGQWKLLWADALPFPADVTVEIVIVADGERIEVEANGIPVLRLDEVQSMEGRVGLFTAAAPGTWFAEIEVHPTAGLFAGQLLEESFDGGMARWELVGEAVEADRWHIEGGALRIEPAPAQWDRIASFDGSVHAVAAGEGRLFVAGAFTRVGELFVSGIAEWDGQEWHEMGAFFDDCRALLVEGADLYAAGVLSDEVQLMVWRGQTRTWSDLGTSIDGSVAALTLHRDLLWAAGSFSNVYIAVLERAQNLVACDLTSRKLSEGFRTDGEVHALVSTPQGFAIGGSFTRMARATVFSGFEPALRIARPETAEPFPGDPPNGDVRALVTAEGVLYAGGDFDRIGGIDAAHVAGWNGTQWSALDGGVDGAVMALAADGRQLFAIGTFQHAGGRTSRGSSRWSLKRLRWEALGGLPPGAVHCVSASGGGVFAGGEAPEGDGWLARLRPVAPEYAVAGLDSWTDYRLSARFEPALEGAAGIAFRWRSVAEHFALLYHAETRTIALERVAGGRREVLGSTAIPAAGTADSLVLTVDCCGQRIIAYLNGRELFTARDETLGQGRVALVAHALGDVIFRDVRVAVPAWGVAHRLVEDEPLPAGMRVRVHSGGGDGGAKGAPGLAHRFATSNGRWGRFRLPRHRAHLRLRNRLGDVIHEIEILPDAAYSPVDHLEMRRADGTAMVLLPSTWNGASHRIRLTYLRHREGLETFTESGSIEPEIVRLAISK